MVDMQALFRRAQQNVQRAYELEQLKKSGLVTDQMRYEEATQKPKPAPYVCMKDRPEVVKLGRQYDAVLTATAELNKCLTRIDYLDRLKYPTDQHAEEKKQKWAEAEEWQAQMDKFWAKHQDKYIGHPELTAARRAYLQKKAEPVA